MTSWHWKQCHNSDLFPVTGHIIVKWTQQYLLLFCSGTLTLYKKTILYILSQSILDAYRDLLTAHEMCPNDAVGLSN